MPIYQYACENCGHQMEAIQKMSDPVLVDCPACNEPSLRKQVTAAAFRLKGTGWYETDFKGSKKQTSTKTSDSNSEPTKKASPDSSNKTDSVSKSA